MSSILFGAQCGNRRYCDNSTLPTQPCWRQGIIIVIIIFTFLHGERKQLEKLIFPSQPPTAYWRLQMIWIRFH